MEDGGNPAGEVFIRLKKQVLVVFLYVIGQVHFRTFLNHQLVQHAFFHLEALEREFPVYL